MQPEVVDEFLALPFVGVIATLRADGRPYTVPVWWLWKDGVIWITGTHTRIWCRQLKRDPRVSLCIEALEPIPGHIEFDGMAHLKALPEFDIWPISRELAEKYVGRGDPARMPEVDTFFANMKTEPRLLFRIVPELVRAIDMRVYRGKRGDREFQERMRAQPAADQRQPR